MLWPKRKKRRALVLTAGLSLSIGSVASASILPTVSELVFGGNGSGTFYDFGSIFSSGSGNIFNDIFSEVTGEVERILATNNSGGLVSPCGIVIMNFAEDYGCTDETVYPDIFGTIFGQVSRELGLPGEVADVVIGRRAPEDIFQEALKDTLAHARLPDITTLSHEGKAVLGKQGLPTPTELLEILTADVSGIPNGSVNTVGGALPMSSIISRGQGLATPNVNPSLVTANQAQRILTEAVTNRGLSSVGQDITDARMTAAQTVSRTSGKLGASSFETAEQQMEAAVQMDTTIKAQTSTQDTLKEALSGMNLMQAQATELAATANNQMALSAQLDNLDLQVGMEMRDGVFSNGRSLQLLNDQMLQSSQRELADRESMRYEFGQGLRLMGAYR
ncbi:MAG: hypothetical protein AAF703_22195 [Cyanobacteria bacterium P01_D01_bin.105]